MKTNRYSLLIFELNLPSFWRIFDKFLKNMNFHAENNWIFITYIFFKLFRKILNFTQYLPFLI